MGDMDKPKPKPKAAPPKVPHSAEVVTLRPGAIPLAQPDNLSGPEALRIVRLLATDTDNMACTRFS
jgi:hypothetical protein